MLIGLVSIPLLISRMGVEAFGLLTIIWTTIGYFSLFDFGLSRALTQQISSNRSQGNQYLYNFSLAGLSGILFVGFIGGLVLFLGAKLLVFHFLNISESLQHEAYQAMLLSAVCIPMVTLTSGFRGIMEGFEDFKSSNLLRLLLGTLNFVLPVLVVLFFSISLFPIVMSLVVSRLFVLILHALMSRKYFSGPRGKVVIRLAELKKLFTFGFWMTLSNLLGPLMVFADRFFISSFLGAAVVAYYTVPQDFVVRLLILPAAISSALFPRLAFVHNSEGPEEGLQLFRKGMKSTALIMAPICLILGGLAYPGLLLWLGESFAQKSWMILSILSVGIFFNSMAHVPFAALQAVGKVRTTSLLHLIEFVIYFPLLFLLMQSQGILGAAIAWSVRTLIDFLALIYFTKRIHKPYAVVRS